MITEKGVVTRILGRCTGVRFASVFCLSEIEAWAMRETASIDLMMELESIRTGAPVAVPACALDEEALLADAREAVDATAVQTMLQENDR